MKREAGNVRQKAEGWGAGELRGNGETERRETKADRDSDRGSLSLSEIAVGMRRVPSAETREARVVGEVIASKPAWKRRRASENDDELPIMRDVAALLTLLRVRVSRPIQAGE